MGDDMKRNGAAGDVESAPASVATITMRRRVGADPFRAALGSPPSVLDSIIDSSRVAHMVLTPASPSSPPGAPPAPPPPADAQELTRLRALRQRIADALEAAEREAEAAKATAAECALLHRERLVDVHLGAATPELAAADEQRRIDAVERETRALHEAEAARTALSRVDERISKLTRALESAEARRLRDALELTRQADEQAFVAAYTRLHLAHSLKYGQAVADPSQLLVACPKLALAVSGLGVQTRVAELRRELLGHRQEVDREG